VDRVSIERTCAGKELQVEGADTEMAREVSEVGCCPSPLMGASERVREMCSQRAIEQQRRRPAPNQPAAAAAAAAENIVNLPVSTYVTQVKIKCARDPRDSRGV